MITRMLRSTISLAAIVVVYQLYALLVVPCLEPALAVQQQQVSTAAEQQMGRRLADKYQQLLANYFHFHSYSFNLSCKCFMNWF